MEWKIKDVEELQSVSSHIITSSTKKNNIILVEGQMGAGKTTLIKTLCQSIGVKDNVNSPTFSLVNEYRDLQNTPIYHFDFYRMNDPEEALDIGVDEYFDSGHICFIEWADMLGPYLPEAFCTIKISVDESQQRTIELI